MHHHSHSHTTSTFGRRHHAHCRAADLVSARAWDELADLLGELVSRPGVASEDVASWERMRVAARACAQRPVLPRLLPPRADRS